MITSPQEPALLTRVSITLCLICIGILLLSACGWGPPPPTWVALQDQSFVLWQTTAGVPVTILGTGEIKGISDTFDASGFLFPTDCSPGWPFGVRGTYLPGIPPRDAVLKSSENAPRLIGEMAIDLTGVVRGTSSNRTILPLTGFITVPNTCHGTLVANVEARPGPDFQHTWQFSDRTSGRVKGSITLKQTIPDGNGIAWIWGDAYFDGNYGKSGHCFVLGPATPHHTSDREKTSTFGYRDRQLITATNLPTTLNPDPPAELHSTISIHGGPCDGQTYAVTLKSH